MAVTTLLRLEPEDSVFDTYSFDTPAWDFIRMIRGTRNDFRVISTDDAFTTQRVNPQPLRWEFEFYHMPAERGAYQGAYTDWWRDQGHAEGVDVYHRGLASLEILKGQAVTVFYGGANWGSYGVENIETAVEHDTRVVADGAKTGAVPTLLRVKVSLVEQSVSNAVSAE